MSVDFTAEGLLDGLADDGARADRVRLLSELHDAGVPLAELRRAVAEERLALLPVERVLAGEGPVISLREAAARSDQALDVVIARRRALGLSVPDPDDPVIAEDEVRAIQIARTFSDIGIADGDMLEISRVIGRAMADVAAAMREMVGRTSTPADASEGERSRRYAEIARAAGPLVGPVLEAALAAHLREQVRQDVIGLAGLEGGGPGTTRVAVAFGDLVGFTRLGEERAVEELGAVARRLEELATDVAGGPVRLVKLIGDAAMLCSTSPERLIEASLALIELSDAEGPDFPMLRVGAAMGDAVLRGGDVYGHPVNLASRLTAVARPGAMLVDERLAQAGGERFEFSFAGTRRLRHMRAEVPTFRARRASTRELG